MILMRLIAKASSYQQIYFHSNTIVVLVVCTNNGAKVSHSKYGWKWDENIGVDLGQGHASFLGGLEF